LIVAKVLRTMKKAFKKEVISMPQGKESNNQLTKAELLPARSCAIHIMLRGLLTLILTYKKLLLVLDTPEQ
jgi:hypothetical protein